MYFSSKDKGEMSAMTYNWAAKDIQIVVVTDGSRILGAPRGGGFGRAALYSQPVSPHAYGCPPVCVRLCGVSGSGGWERGLVGSRLAAMGL
jgi:hypothetical protein